MQGENQRIPSPSPAYRGDGSRLDCDRDPRIRVVTFSTLYPNSMQPTHGVFVENRLRHLVGSGQIFGRVVAPVPWFPGTLERTFPRYRNYALIPATEERGGISVDHPRYLVIPKIGMTLAPYLLYVHSLGTLRRLRAEQDFDLIDAHYFYPDGVAAVMLGRALRKPVVITARGSDVNTISRYAVPRRMIRNAAAHSAKVTTVSAALKRALIEIGVEPSHIRVIRNGVDLDMFRPADRDYARAKIGLDGPTLLSVGSLIELKGHDLTIAALQLLPGHSLLIAGSGPEERSLRRRSIELGVADRIRWLGSVPHHELVQLYAAADALVLASSREGIPNVIMEAMACGTPVIATDVGGVSEVMTGPMAGIVLRERSAAAIAEAVTKLASSGPSRSETRRYAEQFSWEQTTRAQLELFTEILGGPHSSMPELISTRRP